MRNSIFQISVTKKWPNLTADQNRPNSHRGGLAFVLFPVTHNGEVSFSRLFKEASIFLTSYF